MYISEQKKIEKKFDVVDDAASMDKQKNGT